MSNPTSAWFYNQQTQDATANLGLFCKFDNGQSVYLVRQGKFNVYTPIVDHWEIFNLGSPQVLIIPGSLVPPTQGGLSVGDFLINSNGMSFVAYVHCPGSTRSDAIVGTSGFTQLISGAYTNDITKYIDGYELDGSLWMRGTQNVYKTPLAQIIYNDEPHESLSLVLDTVGMNLAFKTYLRYRPRNGSENDNIFVTLKLITWALNASAYYDSGDHHWFIKAGSSITGPSISDSNEFPFWTKTFNP